MISTNLILAMLLGVLVNTQTTNKQFDIWLDDEIIGTLTATELRTDSIIIRSLVSKTTCSVLGFNIKVNTNSHVKRSNLGFLEGAGMRISNRGTKKIESKTTRISVNKYVVEHLEKTQTLAGFEILQSVEDVYFEEPKPRTNHLYSNIHGENNQFVPLGNNRFKMITPDDNESIYTFKNGELVTIEISTFFGDVVTKKRER